VRAPHTANSKQEHSLVYTPRMSRRTGLFQAMARASAAAARQRAAEQRHREVDQRRRVAASARAARDVARQAREAERIARAHLVSSGEQEAERLNSDVSARMEDLSNLLTDAIEDAGPLRFAALRKTPDVPSFDPGKLAQPEARPAIESYLPPPLRGVDAMLPWKRRQHEEATASGKQRFEEDAKAHTSIVSARDRPPSKPPSRITIRTSPVFSVRRANGTHM